MQKTLAEIAQIIGGEVVGDASTVITGLNGIREARTGEITFVANSKYAALARKTQASAIIIPSDLDFTGNNIIRSDDPFAAFSKVAELFVDQDVYEFKGVHPSAVIGDGVEVGENVTIGPNVVIEPRVRIGANSSVMAGCYIGYKVKMGEGVTLHPNVTILDRADIGHRVKIFSGTVIGADGFGFERSDGKHQKIPQMGIVVIEDDVEIGANVTIDRATFSQTIIGRGTKIDNLVQIGHNVITGEHCIIISQVGVGGSTIIGKNAILAGQAGVAGHLTIGEGAIVAAQSGVTGTIEDNSFVSGYPAKPHGHARRVNACLQNLPEYVKKISALEKKIQELENRKNESTES